MSKKTVEILAPAGSYESLKAAVAAGADAVYIGGSKFGARAYANNLDEEQMLEAIDYVHLHKRKIYLTVNTLLKDVEIEQLYDYLLPYYRQGLDAVIVQDTGVLDFVKLNFPDLPIHVSTQMTVTNETSAVFFKEQGVERIVPARELNLEEIREMKAATGLEIECFVHGALCYCYSGQCLLSSMIGGRSGNRGQCAQPCRLPYSVNGKKPQDILSLKDLCTIEMIPELIEAGIDSFKIEGRMKQPDYVYTVVSMYRKYVDLYLKTGKKGFHVEKNDVKKLQGIYRRRGYCEGYYKQHNGKNMVSFKRPEEEIEEINMPEFKIQEKINGNLILSEGNPSKLVLYYGDKVVECVGAEVQKAQKQPLDISRVEKQMRKTGTTQFQFEQLNIKIDGSVFLPMQALNELRREAIELLEKEILKSYRRGDDNHRIFNGRDSYFPHSGNMNLTALIQTVPQLNSVIGDMRLSCIYVDSGIAFEKECVDLVLSKSANLKVYVAMPYIFRKNTKNQFEQKYQQLEELYDGVLIRNWESFQFLKRHNYRKPVVSDYNLYAFNKWSKGFIKSKEIAGITVPVELNVKELQRLDISDSSMIVYGYQPVMFSAGCVRKNIDKCIHEEGILYLTDRYQKKFAVKNCCKYCYNIIYNSSPLILLNNWDEIKSLNPASVRMDFTMESAENTRKIVDMYAAALEGCENIDISNMDYTKGHFKRGVK